MRADSWAKPLVPKPSHGRSWTAARPIRSVAARTVMEASLPPSLAVAMPAGGGPARDAGGEPGRCGGGGGADPQRGGPDGDGGVVAAELGRRDAGGDGHREDREDGERGPDLARPRPHQADREHDQGGDGDTGQRTDGSSQHEDDAYHGAARHEPWPKRESPRYRAEADQGRQWAEDEREIGGEEVRGPDGGA